MFDLKQFEKLSNLISESQHTPVNQGKLPAKIENQSVKIDQIMVSQQNWAADSDQKTAIATNEDVLLESMNKVKVVNNTIPSPNRKKDDQIIPKVPTFRNAKTSDEKQTQL